MPTFIPLFEDSGSEGNEAPLNPANWFMIGVNGPGQLPEFDELMVLNGRITTSVQVECDGQAACNVILPANQYCQVTVKEMDITSGGFLYLRGDTGYFNAVYALGFSGPLDGSNTGTWTMYAINQGGGNVAFTWVDANPLNLLSGDVVTFAVEGDISTGALFFYQNDILVFQGALNLNPEANTMNAVGLVGMQLDVFSDAPMSSEVGVINFRAGAFSSADPPVGGGSKSKVVGTIW